jgi:hypothetical protein
MLVDLHNDEGLQQQTHNQAEWALPDRGPKLAFPATLATVSSHVVAVLTMPSRPSRCIRRKNFAFALP